MNSHRLFGYVLSFTLLAAVMLSGCEREPCAGPCKRFGSCTVGAKDSCTATRAEDCQRSEGCHFYGKCSAQDGTCQRLTAADCQRSNKCLWAGECGFLEGKCTAIKAADCLGSKYCKDKGFCNLKRKYGGRAICTK